MAYCTDADLLIGDAVLGPGSSLSTWVNRAADEVDAKLGWRYALPLAPVPPATELPAHELALLKQINLKIASARFLMATNQSQELHGVHAYARSLMAEGLNDLMCIANGDVDLTALPANTPQADESRKVPHILNRDGESLVEVWENQVMRGEDWYGRPGPL